MNRPTRAEYIEKVMLMPTEEALKRFEEVMSMTGNPLNADQAAELIGILANPNERIHLALWMLEGAIEAGVIAE